MYNAVKALLISLEARRKAAAEYTLNPDMRIEVQLLDAQIAALKKEIEDLEP